MLIAITIDNIHSKKQPTNRKQTNKQSQPTEKSGKTNNNVYVCMYTILKYLNGWIVSTFDALPVHDVNDDGDDDATYKFHSSFFYRSRQIETIRISCLRKSCSFLYSHLQAKNLKKTK